MGFEILPAIDLRGGRVVRLRQGDFAQETAYGDDPVAAATAFVAAGARWLHLVDLDGARSGRPAHGAAMAAIAAAVGSRADVEIAGGLRNEPAVAAVLDAGASRAVVGTAVLADPAFASRLIAIHGPDRIVAALDVRDGTAVGHGWVRGSTGPDVIDAVDQLSDAGVRIFEVTSIERDGLLEGPNLALYERVVALDRGAVIASGGIATLADLEAVRDIGCNGAIIGRALYEGSLDLVAALELTGR
jgi:phosphoribosylformimino-5-aminoimidazole carboxamide ribotide isomerase